MNKQSHRHSPSWLNVTMFLVAVCWSGLAMGQGTVKGFLKSKTSGEAVMFASVTLEGTSFGVSTDVEGYYSLSRVPAGNYTLVVSSLEYETVKEAVEIKNDKVLTRNILLEPMVVALGGAEVRADREEQTTQVRTSVETIRPADIKRIPSFGGSPDLVQALQVLPGFVSTGDQGGQLYIRGGSPIQNKVLLDGMLIYNAFHSIGLFSVFDSDALANADVYTGAFSAKYGGRISSVMDIRTKDGNMRETEGKVGASPFGAKVLVHGPLKPMTDDAGGISYLMSVKHSYLEQSSQLFYPYIDDGRLPFSFTDGYGKLTFGGGDGSKLSLFGFGFNDFASVLDDSTGVAFANYGWRNVGGGGNFTVVPPGSSGLLNGHFAVSNYRINFDEVGSPDRFSEVQGFNFGLDFKYVIGEDNVEYGVEVVGMRTDFQTTNPLGVGVEQQENTTELGGYVDYTIKRGAWIVQPSLRMQYYSSLAKMRPEPRFGIKYKASERLRLKAAAGMYSQNVISANSDRDVVNLFYGFLAGPQELPDELIYPNEDEPVDRRHSLQTANHLVTGLEFDVTERLNVNVEGYVKHFTQLTNFNRNKLFPDNQRYANEPEGFRKDFIVETGRAVGMDVVVKYEERETYLWFVYGLGNVDRWDMTTYAWYDPVFDRRHNVNVVASQGFGQGDWLVSARWNLGSGLPFTQSQGYYQAPGGGGGISGDYLSSNPNAVSIYLAGLNEGRLPAYHRLDLNVKRTWKFDGNGALDLSAGVTNAYSRENVFYINRITGQRKDQLPFLPSVGLDWSF